MAETDDKTDARLGLWEATLKAVNSLLIAHGAGLVACLTLLKDYDTNPHLEHIGWFIALFAFGLLWGMFAYFELLIHRRHVVAATTPWLEGREWRSAGYSAFISFMCLVVAVVLAAQMFALL